MTFDLPLELVLQHAASAKLSNFPGRRPLWEGYQQAKRYLDEHYFSHTGAGLAQDGGRYSRHDLRHVEDVIETVGRLVGLDAPTADVTTFDLLEPYEVFVLLVAILLHDAGNAAGRKDHERRAPSIAKAIQPILGIDDTETRLIAGIAQAHGGETPSGDKDTIRALRSDQAKLFGVSVRQRMLAALLKLGDELSENPMRADKTVLDTHAPPGALTFHRFSKASNISIDREGRTIDLNFTIDLSWINEENHADCGTPGYLSDYIAARVIKTNLERRYCNPFLHPVAYFDRVRARLQIFDDDSGTLDPVVEEAFELSDYGFPTEDERDGAEERKLRERFAGHCIKKRLAKRDNEDGDDE